MIIAGAQIIPEKGNVDKNIETHIQLIEEASKKNVNLIVFPELSLTGYEPELAQELAFSEMDSRLNRLIKVAYEKQMIIVVGAPISLKNKLHIGAFILYPKGSIGVHTKRYLHPGEEKYFVPDDIDHQVVYNGERASLAVCADISNPKHPEAAFNKNASMYLASVLCTPGGYNKDVEMLKEYARKYKMLVMMVNFGGNSGIYEVAGKSIILSKQGEVISQLVGKGNGLVCAKFDEERWVSV